MGDGTFASFSTWILPTALLCNAALLLVANVFDGASTQVSGEAPLGLLKPHTASSDNLFSAVERLWRSKAYFIMVLVALLSGAWPYIKLFLTGLCVYRVRSGYDSPVQGLSRLRVVEAFGKYSFADILLVCCNCAIFNISTGGKYRIMAMFKLELNLWMEIHLPCILLFVAVTLSNVLTHIAIVVLERHVALSFTAPSMDARGAWDDRQAGHAELGHDRVNLGDRLQSKDLWWRSRNVGLLCALAGIALLLLGARVPFVTIDRQGFLGNLIRPEDARHLHLSIISVANRVATGAHAAGESGHLAVIAASFIAVAFVAPLSELLALTMAAWHSEASSRGSRCALAVADWCSSFSCVELVLLTAAAIVFDLQTTIDFNVGDECKPFKVIMNDATLLRLAGLGFATSKACFSAAPRFALGCAPLLGYLAFRSVAWRALGGVGIEESPRCSGEKAN